MKNLFVFAFAAFSSVLMSGCAGLPTGNKTGAENATSATYTAVSVNDLPRWWQDQQQQAVTALQKSCAVMMKRSPETPVNPAPVAGTIREWQAPCEAVLKAPNDVGLARNILETYFTPYAIDTPNGNQGLFTGYYETTLNGSRVKTARYNVPLLKRPADLVMVDLGQFRPNLKGERIAGKVVDGNLKPYASRADIENGALNKDKLELAWVDDADAAFFLHIQGSGRVHFEDGTEMRIGYDGQNGHIYTAIGKELIARGELTPETTNLESIRAWLKAHPAEAPALRQKNESYVFFKILDGDEGPLGAQGVALTATRSLAVDPRFIPYGAPVYVAIPHPTAAIMMNRLMVAQDTGGAIRGPVRGDFFWGSGEAAERNAGYMKSRGRAWVLLPKTRPAQMRIDLPPPPNK